MTIERRVRIIADSDASNPRTDWDCHAGRMLCWHSGYNLGDEHSYDSDDCLRQLAFEHDADLEDYVDRLENEVCDKLYDRASDNGCTGYEECSGYAERFIRKRIDDRIDAALSAGYVILPLYLYDHSGITMSTGSFACSWDSGQVGFIVCDAETIEKEFDGDRDRAEAALESEVKVYDQYLTGDVWGFVVEERESGDDNEWEGTDSCWGFYGSDPSTNGMGSYLDDELTALAGNAELEYSY